MGGASFTDIPSLLIYISVYSLFLSFWFFLLLLLLLLVLLLLLQASGIVAGAATK